jgi:hypothetical protein
MEKSRRDDWKIIETATGFGEREFSIAEYFEMQVPGIALE